MVSYIVNQYTMVYGDIAAPSMERAEARQACGILSDDGTTSSQQLGFTVSVYLRGGGRRRLRSRGGLQLRLRGGRLLRRLLLLLLRARRLLGCLLAAARMLVGFL